MAEADFKLVILSEQLRGQSYPLEKDVYTVGRVEKRDICIKEPTVSSFHCEFVRDGKTFKIVDNNSTNGTRVNNVPINEQVLQNTDIVQIGSVEVLFDSNDKSVTTVTRTRTNIDLDNTDLGKTSVKGMNNASPFAKNKGRESKAAKLVLGIILGILVLAIIALIVFIILIILTKSSPGVIIPLIDILN